MRLLIWTTSRWDSVITFFHVGLVSADDLELQSDGLRCQQLAAAISVRDNQISENEGAIGNLAKNLHALRGTLQRKKRID